MTIHQFKRTDYSILMKFFRQLVMLGKIDLLKYGKNSLSIQQCEVFPPTASSLIDFICDSSCIAQNIPIRYFFLYYLGLRSLVMKQSLAMSCRCCPPKRYIRRHFGAGYYRVKTSMSLIAKQYVKQIIFFLFLRKLESGY